MNENTKQKKTVHVRKPTLASNLQEPTDSAVNCTLCNGHFTDPKLLPCLHTFCLSCLTEYNKSRQLSPSGANCPICGATFSLAAGRELDSLPCNSFARRLVELQKLMSPPAIGSTCEACSEAKNIEFYCLECEQHLCSSCNNIHRKLKVTSLHSLIAVGGENKKLPAESFMKARVEMCIQHPQERATLFCSQCKCIFCTVCFVAQHKSHSCHDLTGAVQAVRSKLQEFVMVTQDRRDKVKSGIEKIASEERGFIQSILDAEQNVKDKAQKERELINRHENELLKRLSEVKREKLLKIGNAKDWCESTSSSMEQCTLFVSDILERGSDADLVGLYGLIENRVTHVFSARPEPLNKENVVFTPSSTTVNPHSLHGGAANFAFSHNFGNNSSNATAVQNTLGSIQIVLKTTGRPAQIFTLGTSRSQSANVFDEIL